MELAELLVGLRPVPTDRPGRFVGAPSPETRRSTYGGQFVAQSLLAAADTVEAGRWPHSLHGSFLRAGDADAATDYDVETVRDGRGYSHREVRASQAGRECFRAIVGFQVPQPGGDEHGNQVAAATVDPETLPSYVEWVRGGTDNADHFWLSEQMPLDIRIEGAPPARFGQTVTGPIRIWLRFRGDVPGDDPILHAALVGWLSDKTLSDGVTLCHGHRWTDAGVDSVSLDHALWLLRPGRADQWICCEQEVVSTGSGRGLARATFTTADGIRLAQAAQEAVLQLPA